MRKKATKDRVAAMEERVDRTCQDLARCEEALKTFKTENKSLRKDKMDLLEKVAELVSGDKE
jgi:regulator of replication initiation timing